MTAEELEKWKARGGAAPKVITIHGPRPFRVLEPAKMGFRSRLAAEDIGADSCAGCVFRTQEKAVCDEAERVALAAGLPRCEERDPETGRTFVYWVRDPRQRDLVEEFS